MAKDRPPSFQFYPADFVSDPAVMAMTLEARGAYITLLCAAWNQPETGTLPDDDEWLSRTSGANGRWPAIRDQVRAAFRQGPGVLVQRRMQQERESQKRRYEQAKSGARKTNEAKRLARIAGRTAVAPSSSSSRESKKESKTSCPDGHAKEWLEAYDRDFYPDYPPRGRNARRMNKAQGRKVWGTIKPQTQEQFDKVYAALVRDKAEWASRGSPEFIPMIDVWLRRKAWED